ncbi:MAG: hypothetical protein K9L95_01455 [Candidatus Omnitrophica bacterium]|nr:hypothetical protein [Candidatus Omnitrophota bacterium]MCF7876827.1 hypothetical protein [Candidatus Omnitrophota bacterium]MCF7878121.1 hypothetical protein [Candidatus Omnitrophota bacterium]MCF7892974.1 hypothetical protein [Candidatus Omnitrophota bacterium]
MRSFALRAQDDKRDRAQDDKRKRAQDDKRKRAQDDKRDRAQDDSIEGLLRRFAFRNDERVSFVTVKLLLFYFCPI